MSRSSVVRVVRLGLAAAALLLAGGALFNVAAMSKPRPKAARSHGETSADAMFVKGRNVFRFDTFGDEPFWSGVLKLDKVIEGAKHGGVGPGVSPKTALSVGLKVDSAALPKAVVKA